ncbi:hypothetical protein JOH50_006288 [Rhizobium leguminosarum]|uniref:hypothetical protein n=1 Tax=Rhizobium leguminosarum TaxID=384 RepID=UPI001EB38104|nr:hypothetical protein [Rhizobium leguminosarum]
MFFRVRQNFSLSQNILPFRMALYLRFREWAKRYDRDAFAPGVLYRLPDQLLADFSTAQRGRNIRVVDESAFAPLGCMSFRPRIDQRQSGTAPSTRHLPVQPLRSSYFLRV